MITMKNDPSRKKTEEMCCCCHMHGKKPIFIGLMLLIAGLALNYGYSLTDALMLIGGILIAKGILVMIFRKG